MIKLGLTGYPLGHSLSPRIHEAALRSCDLDGSYSLFPIPADDKQGLSDLLARVRSGEITGLNVTIPHKQNVMEFLDELTPTAKAIGAVNTIYRRNNRLIGENTDAPGFLADLKQVFKFSFFTFPPSALILGAGGSARAVIYALLNNGWEVIVAARRSEQARQLADAFANHQLSRSISMGPVTVLSLSSMGTTLTHLKPLLSDLFLIVNTTPVGMTPNTDVSPWPENLTFPPRAAIYDLVYNPLETKLVGDARAAE